MLTFVAIPHGVKVDVVLVAPQEEKAEPGVKGVDGDDEKQADDVALLVGDGVGAQVQVDLGGRSKAGLGTRPTRHPSGRKQSGPPWALPLADTLHWEHAFTHVPIIHSTRISPGAGRWAAVTAPPWA